MKKNITEADFFELLDYAAKRLKERENKIAAYIDEFNKYPRIFFYAAGKDAKFIAGFLNDILPSKKAAFIDQDKRKHGLQILPGIFCEPIESMYGYKDKAIIIITAHAIADSIEWELLKKEYQSEGKLVDTPINSEFCQMIANNGVLKECLNLKNILIEQFKLTENKQIRSDTYYFVEGAMRDYSFKNYDNEDFIPYQHDPLNEDFILYEHYYIKDFLAEHLRQNRGIFVCCGYFSDDMLQDIEDTGMDCCSKIYDFEINRLYIEKELKEKLPKDRIINAALGDKDCKLKGNNRPPNLNIGDNLSFASDDFINVKSLDKFFEEKENSENVTLIYLKQHEAHKAVYGMKNIIKQDKPLLAISILDNKIILINSIKSIDPSYKFIVLERMLYAYIQ